MYIDLVFSNVTLADGGAKGVIEVLRSVPIALVGKTTCAYSLEANNTLVSAAANCGGADIVTTFWVDEMPMGGDVHAALKQELKQATVPYVFINGEFIGGCDDTKQLQAAGTLAPKLYAAAAAHGLRPAKGKTASKQAESKAGAKEQVLHGNIVIPDEKFVDPTFKPVVADGATKAYPPLFFFPEVVDSTVIRLTAAQVAIICIIAIIFRKHVWAHYMVLGLMLENLARLIFGTGPSPLGQISRCIAVFLKPSFRPGIPKQFAVGCGTFMSVVATIFLFTSGFDPEEIIPALFLAVYALLSTLESGIGFCMGCVIFGFMVKLNILSKDVYNVGISSKPEMEYTYEEAVKWLPDLPEEEIIRISYPGKPPSIIDVFYKTKSNDHDKQSFNIIKVSNRRLGFMYSIY